MDNCCLKCKSYNSNLFVINKVHLICGNCILKNGNDQLQCPCCNDKLKSLKTYEPAKGISEKLLCKFHHKKPYRFICKDCTQLSCDDCITAFHNGHTMLNEKEEETIKDEMENKKKQSEDTKKTIESINFEINKIINYEDKNHVNFIYGLKKLIQDSYENDSRYKNCNFIDIGLKEYSEYLEYHTKIIMDYKFNKHFDKYHAILYLHSYNMISCVKDMLINFTHFLNSMQLNHVSKELLEYPYHNSSNFEIIDDLGSGSFGKVKKAKILKLVNEIIAIKIVEEKHFNKVEIETNKLLNDSDYSLNYYGYRKDKLGNYYIYLQYIENSFSIKTILQEMKNFEENDLLLVAIEIAKALQTIHNAGIIHRDLKCANILIIPDKRSIKLIDYGLSKIITDNSKYYSYVGTETHMAPEVVMRNNTASRKSDIYSFGCVLIEMAGGNLSEEHVVIPCHLSVALKNIIQQCLLHNFDARPDAQTLINLLLILSRQNHIQTCSIEELEGYFASSSLNDIPEGTKYVSFLPPNQIINQESIIIPPSVKYLNLGNEFDIIKYSRLLPQYTITTLVSGYPYLQSIRERDIPTSVFNLKLTNYNLVINKNTIPRTVNFLTLGNDLSQEAIESLKNLPANIINLTFGTTINISDDHIIKYINSSITNLVFNGNPISLEKSKNKLCH